jgi:hypothetical protein
VHGSLRYPTVVCMPNNYIEFKNISLNHTSTYLPIFIDGQTGDVAQHGPGMKWHDPFNFGPARRATLRMLCCASPLAQASTNGMAHNIVIMPGQATRRSSSVQAVPCSPFNINSTPNGARPTRIERTGLPSGPCSLYDCTWTNILLNKS